MSAIDYAYEGLPATLVAGTRIVMHNDSTSEMHELIAMRLPDDEARPPGELLELPEPELESMFTGEPAAVILAPPGEDGFPVVGDGSIDEPGRYLVICAIPTGADPEEYLNAPEGEGPHRSMAVLPTSSTACGPTWSSRTSDTSRGVRSGRWSARAGAQPRCP